jgi:hypothetical protein
MSSRESQQQPISTSFEKIIQALGVYDHSSDHRPARLRKPIGPEAEAGGDQWAFHAVQAAVWAGVGGLFSCWCDSPTRSVSRHRL